MEEHRTMSLLSATFSNSLIPSDVRSVRGDGVRSPTGGVTYWCMGLALSLPSITIPYAFQNSSAGSEP